MKKAAKGGAAKRVEAVLVKDLTTKRARKSGTKEERAARAIELGRELREREERRLFGSETADLDARTAAAHELAVEALAEPDPAPAVLGPVSSLPGYGEAIDSLTDRVRLLVDAAGIESRDAFIEGLREIGTAVAVLSRLARGGAKAKRSSAGSAGVGRKHEMSALSIAQRVLLEQGPMRARPLSDAVIAAGWVTTGSTPWSTLGASIGTEISSKGAASRFARGPEKGTFMAVQAVA